MHPHRTKTQRRLSARARSERHKIVLHIHTSLPVRIDTRTSLQQIGTKQTFSPKQILRPKQNRSQSFVRTIKTARIFQSARHRCAQQHGLHRSTMY
jgi:hypothetical protein